MTPLGLLVKQNFKKNLFNKRGSIFIEASIVMPLACIITIMMIQISIVYYNEFAKQVHHHMDDISKKSFIIQTEIIRNYENIF